MTHLVSETLQGNHHHATTTESQGTGKSYPNLQDPGWDDLKGPVAGKKGKPGIDPIVEELRRALAPIRTFKDFKEIFDPIHIEWHNTGKFCGKFIGFLSFHHEALACYQRLQSTTGEPALRPEPLHDRFRPQVEKLSGLRAPRDLSRAINGVSGIHELAHTEGQPVFDILSPDFWVIHRFIDDVFMQWLGSNGLTYEDIDQRLV